MKLPLLLLGIVTTFLGAYLAVLLMTTHAPQQVPVLIGCSLEQAATIAAAHQLNLRIARVDTTAAYAPGTVLEQHPTPGSMSRIDSPIYIVLAQLPEQHRTPHLIGKSHQAAEQLLHKASIKALSYPVPSNTLRNIVIAQTPTAKTPCPGTVTLYYTQQPIYPVVIPSLLGLTYQEVYDWAAKHAVELTLVGPPYRNAKVIAQQPQAGSISRLSPLRIEIATN